MADEIKNEVETQIDETNPTDESKNTEAQNVDTKIPYDRFKAKVDEANALKEKLAAIEKAQEEAKRKELEEQNEYKTLYEQALQQAQQAKQEAISIKKTALLAQAGYSAEQTKLLAKLVEGESDEELSESIKLLQTTIPAQDSYGDPSAMNGAKVQPETVDGAELGKTMYAKIKHKLRG